MVVWCRDRGTARNNNQPDAHCTISIYDVLYQVTVNTLTSVTA